MATAHTIRREMNLECIRGVAVELRHAWQRRGETTRWSATSSSRRALAVRRSASSSCCAWRDEADGEAPRSAGRLRRGDHRPLPGLRPDDRRAGARGPALRRAVLVRSHDLDQAVVPVADAPEQLGSQGRAGEGPRGSRSPIGMGEGALSRGAHLAGAGRVPLSRRLDEGVCERRGPCPVGPRAQPPRGRAAVLQHPDRHRT